MSEVGVTGQVLSTFTDVFVPYHLSLDSKGNVLVADSLNRRILLLSSQLELQRVLDNRTSQVNQLLPTRLCYNELVSQLYVVHDVFSIYTLSLFNLH